MDLVDAALWRAKNILYLIGKSHGFSKEEVDGIIDESKIHDLRRELVDTIYRKTKVMFYHSIMFPKRRLVRAYYKK